MQVLSSCSTTFHKQVLSKKKNNNAFPVKRLIAVVKYMGFRLNVGFRDQKLKCLNLSL